MLHAIAILVGAALSALAFALSFVAPAAPCGQKGGSK